MCSYNAEEFIEQTVKSLLSQEYSNTELLILDNNSEDNTLSILKRFESKKVRVYSSAENLGPYKGLNFLLDEAKGKYISISDHDDIYHPEKIKQQVYFLENHPKYIGCGSNLLKYYEKNNTFKLIKVKEIGTLAPHPSLVFRNNNGLRYNTNIEYKTDTYFMRHILCDNKKVIYNIQKPLYLSRVRMDKNNLSRIWNDNLTFRQIYNYYKYSKDKRMLLKLSIKKFIAFNALQGIYHEFGSKKIDYLKHNNSFNIYKEYLK